MLFILLAVEIVTQSCQTEWCAARCRAGWTMTGGSCGETASACVGDFAAGEWRARQAAKGQLSVSAVCQALCDPPCGLNSQCLLSAERRPACYCNSGFDHSINQTCAPVCDPSCDSCAAPGICNCTGTPAPSCDWRSQKIALWMGTGAAIAAFVAWAATMAYIIRRGCKMDDSGGFRRFP